MTSLLLTGTEGPAGAVEERRPTAPSSGTEETTLGRSARRAAARRATRFTPFFWSVLLHAAAISAAWWAIKPSETPPQLALASFTASVASTASEGEATPPEEVVLPPLPDVVPPPDLLPEVTEPPPDTPEEVLEPLEATEWVRMPAPAPPVPLNARTKPRLTFVPPPVSPPPAARPAPPARTVESVAFARVEGGVPFGTNQPPVYPAEAAARGWRGTTILRLRLDETGIVREAWVAVSSGYPILDQAALDAARRWRYTPARRGGQPTEMIINAPIRFE